MSFCCTFLNCGRELGRQEGYGEYLQLVIFKKQPPSHITCSLGLYDHRFAAATNSSSISEGENFWLPPKKRLSTVKSQQRWKRACLNSIARWEKQRIVFLKDYKRPKTVGWITRSPPFFLSFWLKSFQIQIVPTLNYEIWLTCGFPQCCTL